MESPVLTDLFEKQWTSTTKSCLDRMEPQDRKTIRSFRSYEELQNHLVEDQDDEVSQSSLQELDMLRPRLVDIHQFSNFFATRLGPILDMDTFWGLLALLLTLALQRDSEMRQIAHMLKKLCIKCHDFMLYCQPDLGSSKEEKDSCFDMCVAITTFFADAVQVLREVDDDFLDQLGPLGGQESRMVSLANKFASAVDDIEDTLKRVERVKAIHERQYGGDRASLLSYLSLAPRAFQDTIKLPCFVLPATRTTRFFNREDVIEKIEAHFQAGNALASVSALALHGMGGVGKSHVAMKYVEKRQSAKALDAIFWVNSENSISIQQSFTDIALRLRLPDTGPASHNENRMILKGWMQHTDCRWMIVYDNAETSTLLREYWPLSGSKGQVLITTRNHTLGFDPADAGLEVPSWDTKMGSQFLLHLLAGHISADLLANESKSAYSLSERLSGHALALSNMCGLLHRRSWSLTELVEVYDRSKDFKDGLEVVWQLSFQNLQPDCAALLSAFSFCSPEAIPHSLFELNQDAESLTENMLWYLDSDRLTAATEDLLTLALVKRDRYERVFSLHRLIAVQYHRFLGQVRCQKAFWEASILMYNAFPKSPKTPGTTRASLYNVWDKCQLWVQHVLHLKNSFVKQLKQNQNFSACKETCELWVQCQRFLLETQNWRELEDLVAINKIAMATLPVPDRETYLLSSTELHVSSMWAFRGHFKLALESLLEAHRLKLSESPIDLQSTCWIEDNLATIYGCLQDFERAIGWIERSRARWQSWSQSAGVEFKCPPLLMLTHGRLLAHAGRLDEANTQLTDAVDGFGTAEPFVWAPAAVCKFTLARLRMLQGKHTEAEIMLAESQSMWLEGDKSRTLDFNGVINYHLGCCAMELGDLLVAVKRLQEAKAICTIHKHMHPAKYARCALKLAEALRLVDGRLSEADQLHQEGKALYFQLTDHHKTTRVTPEDLDALIHISQR